MLFFWRLRYVLPKQYESCRWKKATDRCCAGLVCDKPMSLEGCSEGKRACVKERDEARLEMNWEFEVVEGEGEDDGSTKRQAKLVLFFLLWFSTCSYARLTREHRRACSREPSNLREGSSKIVCGNRPRSVENAAEQKRVDVDALAKKLRSRTRFEINLLPCSCDASRLRQENFIFNCRIVVGRGELLSEG